MAKKTPRKHLERDLVAALQQRDQALKERDEWRAAARRLQAAQDAAPRSWPDAAAAHVRRWVTW